jgi:predicted RNA-binding Zn-ribbon protein involved in translation (DUF1610 family)
MDTREQTLDEFEEHEKANLTFNAECPGCNASIEFNPAAGKLKCPYCDYETDIAVPENEEDRVAQELDFATAEQTGNYDWGTEKKTVSCKSCGAESIYDAIQVADSCPYCGSNQVMEASTVNTLAPNGLVAFEVTDKQAGENFQKWINGKWFMPKAAKQSARADAFDGIYLPYWTFDTKTSSRYTARFGKYRDVPDGDGKTKRVTDWYKTDGFYQEFIDDHLVAATTRYDTNMMEQIEPYNLLNNKGYRPEYVSGFLAERYSVGLQDGWKIAKKEIHAHIEDQIGKKIRREKNADVVDSIRFSTTHDNITYKYLMLPMWLSSFKFNGKIYHFMVNGQTGKVGGKYPISAIRVTIAVAVVIAIIAMIIFFFNQ